MSHVALYSSTPPGRALEDALDRLRIAVEPEFGAAHMSADVRARVTSLCRIARHAGVQPERLVVRVKDTLHRSARLAVIEPTQRSEIVSRVVSLVITRYFLDD